MSARRESLDEPPAKRQKLQRSVEIQRSPDFWFKTGNFVLIASQRVAYRIHGDMLGRKSKVFSDLLDLDEVPRPDSEDTMDGCPIVHVTDSPEDLSVFLSLVYDSLKYHQRDAQEPRWSTVRIMILLGDKYDASEIREEGLVQLGKWYADDIEEWDRRDEKFFANETDHLSVANILHNLDEPELLASALFFCSKLCNSYLVFGDPDTGSPPLCADHLVRTFNFIRDAPGFWSDFSLDVHSDGLFPRDCADCLPLHPMVQSLFNGHFQAALGTAIYGVVDISAWLPLSQQLENIICETCMSYYKMYVQGLRQDYLTNLPEYL